LKFTLFASLFQDSYWEKVLKKNALRSIAAVAPAHRSLRYHLHEQKGRGRRMGSKACSLTGLQAFAFGETPVGRTSDWALEYACAERTTHA
jgi:hypothetical protein